MASDGPGTPYERMGRTGLRATLFALAWIVLWRVSALFVFPPLQNSAIWLPTGMALAVLVRAERRHWPTYGLAIFLAEALPGLFIGIPLGVGLLWGLGNSLSTLASAWLLCSWPGPPLAFRQVRDVAGLVAALAGGSLLSATFGAMAVSLWRGGPPFGWQWLTWYLGDVLGGVLTASLMLAWIPEQGRLRLPSHSAELGVTLVVLALVAHLIFGEWHPMGILLSLPYAGFPLVLWMALRHGPRGATLGAGVLGVIAAWHTAAGRGPFGEMAGAGLEDEFLSLQSFVAALNLSALTLAALVCERRRAEQIQQRLAQASAVLAESRDYRETMPRIARLVVPDMAAGFAAWRVGAEGQLEPLAQAEVSAVWQEQLQQRLRQPEVPGLSLVSTLDGTAVLARLQRHGKELGGIALVQAPGYRPRAQEVEFAENLAYRCALAMENASLFEQAQEAILVRDEFIAIAAHELRTPLTSLKQYLHHLARALAQLPHADKALTHFHQVIRQISRLSQLVENLLVVGRINTGQLFLRRERVDLAELVRGVVERLSEDLRKARCVPRLKLQEHTRGWWDRERLEQALINLLGNAMKFGARHPIDIELSKHAGRARLRVRDHGIGVAPEALGRIFDRFERAVSSNSYGGLGLGLFLTREIIEAHGGTIHAESQPGQGTTFTLELPIAHLPVSAGEPRPHA